MLRKLFTKILLKVIDVEILAISMDQSKIERLKQNVNLKKNAVLHNVARISNFQFDKVKITVGSDTHIFGELLVWANGGEILIGENCFVGEYSRIWSGNRIEIGNHVLISHNVNIIDSNSHELNEIERATNYNKMWKYGHPKEIGNIETQAIVIEDYVWINMNAVILKGVRIGKGSIITACSVVTKSVPPFSFVSGAPAQIIKNLKPEQSI